MMEQPLIHRPPRCAPLSEQNCMIRPGDWSRSPQTCYPSFHPETAFFRCSSVNLQADLCGVTVYASAQALDFPCYNGKLLVSNLKT